MELKIFGKGWFVGSVRSGVFWYSWGEDWGMWQILGDAKYKVRIELILFSFSGLFVIIDSRSK